MMYKSRCSSCPGSCYQSYTPSQSQNQNYNAGQDKSYALGADLKAAYCGQ